MESTSRHAPYEVCDCPNPEPGRPYHCAAMPACPDCGVGAGREHDDGCDVARCIGAPHRLLWGPPDEWFARQRLSCTEQDDPDHDCGRDVWSGKWPTVCAASGGFGHRCTLVRDHVGLHDCPDSPTRWTDPIPLGRG